jgi:hypothetical protein
MFFLIFQITTTTINYFEFESHIEIEIQDPDHDFIGIPSIELCFDPYLIFIYEYTKRNNISGIDNLIDKTPEFKEFKGKLQNYDNYSYSLAQNFSFSDLKNNFKCIINTEFEGNSIDCDTVFESVESYLTQEYKKRKDWKCFQMSFNSQKLKSHRIKRTKTEPFLNFLINFTSIPYENTIYS